MPPLPACHLSLVKSHFKDSPEVTAIIRPRHLTHHTTLPTGARYLVHVALSFRCFLPPPPELLIRASAGGEVLTAAAAQIVYLQTFPVLGFFNQLLQFKLHGGDTSVRREGSQQAAQVWQCLLFSTGRPGKSYGSFSNLPPICTLGKNVNKLTLCKLSRLVDFLASEDVYT